MSQQSRFSNRKSAKYLALALYSLILSFLIMHAPFQVFPVDDQWAVQQAEFQISDLSQLELLPENEWELFNLPDDWYESGYQSQQVWYQASISVEVDAADLWALYLPHVTHNAEAFINGVWIGRGGDFNAPVSRHHNEPLLFPFASGLLQKGENSIQLRVKSSHPSQGLLDQFYLAPLSEIQSAYEWKHWLRFDFIRGVTIAMYILAAVLCFFWLLRRQDNTYGIFSLLLFVWATHNLNLFVSDIPISARLWEAMTMSTLGWAVVTMVFFNHRYVGQINHGVEKALLIFSFIGLGIFLLPDIRLILQIGAKFWDTTLVLIGVYSIFYLIREYQRRGDLDIYLMLLAGIPILICGFHDIRVVNHLANRSEGLIIQYSVIPAIFLFSWFLVRRFIRSLNQAEELAVTLEAKVAERGEKIEQQYAQLSKLEKERTLANERERIMRDMHDGIGGQLMSLQSSLKSQVDPVLVEARGRIQNCVDDLRAVINSLDPAMSDLSTLLGSMRARLEKQLKAADISLRWQISELESSIELSPDQGLHLMRIIQEAVTNCVKHSEATELVLSVSDVENTGVLIRIQDNGKGFNMDANQAVEGRGLKNIRYRAEKLNLGLAIKSDNSNHKGTLIELRIDSRDWD